MELITPGLGLIFWMTLSFGLVLLVLRKYAWRPILASIRVRERVIAKSVINSRRIEEEFARLEQIKMEKTLENEKFIQEVQQHAHEEAEEIIAQAKRTAVMESRNIIDEAARSIAIQKKAALMEVKGEVAKLSVDMAEKVLQEEFSDKSRNTLFVQRLLDKMILN